MNKCPICGKPYIKSKPTRFGGMEYIHEIATTFTSSCQQSSASYQAAQQKMHPTLGESATSDSESKPAPKRVI